MQESSNDDSQSSYTNLWFEDRTGSSSSNKTNISLQNSETCQNINNKDDTDSNFRNGEGYIGSRNDNRNRSKFNNRGDNRHMYQKRNSFRNDPRSYNRFKDDALSEKRDRSSYPSSRRFDNNQLIDNHNNRNNQYNVHNNNYTRERGTNRNYFNNNRRMYGNNNQQSLVRKPNNPINISEDDFNMDQDPFLYLTKVKSLYKSSFVENPWESLE